MSKMIEGPLQEFGGHVEEFAGKKIHDKVMAGAEDIVKSTDDQKISLWMKDAIDHLDGCTSPEKCQQIMSACGRNCYNVHRGMVGGYKTRRQKYKTEQAFLAAELKRTVKNSRLEMQGNTLVQYYTPRRMASNERCFCSLIKHLPEGVNASPTYCQCSRAFIEAQWQEALGRPVQVDVKETSLTGAKECKFIIHL